MKITTRREDKMSGYIATAFRSDWETPRELFQALDAEFHFTVDVCATSINRKCEKFFTPEQDGLSQDWGGAGLLVQSPVWARNRRLGEKGGGEQRYHGDATPGADGHEMVS